jgi:branched-chain amino acid transport system substrate-binding protein
MRLRMIGLALAWMLVLPACGARFEGHEDAASSGTANNRAPSAPATPSTPAATTNPSSTAPGPAPGVTDREIKIGYLLPITGAAPIPSRFDQGVNVYWNDVNAKGGIDGRQVKVIIEDTQSQAEVGKDKAKKLIEDDNVFAIVVLDRLENQEAIGRYLNSRKVPNIEIQTPANLAEDQIWSFGVTIDHAVQGKLVADYFVKVLGAKKVGIVSENVPTLDPGRGAFEKEIKARGGEIVYAKKIEGQQNDFSNEALALSNSGAKAVWLYMAPTTAATLANQADSAGFHPTWFANSISWAFDLVFVVGPKSLKGARAFSPWLPLSDPRTDTYKKAYTQQNPDVKPDDLGILGWGVGQIVAEGLRKAGKDLGQNSFRNALQHLQFRPDIWAPLDFRPGVREGANVVAVLEESGGHWELEHDFTGKF